MSLSEEEIRRFFRIHKTLHQMLNDRGYIVTESELGMTHEQFVDKYGEDMKREDLGILKIKRNDDSDKVCSNVLFFFTICGSVVNLLYFQSSNALMLPCGSSLSFSRMKQRLESSSLGLTLCAWNPRKSSEQFLL